MFELEQNMNILETRHLEIQWIVIDLNCFFAACEQQEDPRLRGKPVAVAPMITDSTCVLAASYAAKARGIKTGTMIKEAKRMCPGLVVVQARPQLYVDYHHRIFNTVEKCIPVADVLSVDEVACQLDKTQRTPEAITKLAHQIKSLIRTNVGECLTSSIGAASNRLLAKLGSDMMKPDGLTILSPEQMPHPILHLNIEALCGIGAHMGMRLRHAGIDTMQKLWDTDDREMRRIWGSVVGARFHALLHGVDLPAPLKPRRSIGHQHVLAPEHRHMSAALLVMRRLLARAADRLRHDNFYCCRLIIDIKWTSDLGYWVAERKFSETCSTGQLNHVLMALWADVPPQKPLRVGVTLTGLVASSHHQFNLFELPKSQALTTAIDKLNDKYGSGTIDFGVLMPPMTSKIAFQRVPDLREF